MNGNFKYTLTDEQRNQLYINLTGKNTKGMVSRADVCRLLQEALDEALKVYRPAPKPEYQGADVSYVIEDEISDGEVDVDLVMKQNKLLHSRVNRLQHLLDTQG